MEQYIVLIEKIKRHLPMFPEISTYLRINISLGFYGFMLIMKFCEFKVARFCEMSGV